MSYKHQFQQVIHHSLNSFIWEVSDSWPPYFACEDEHDCVSMDDWALVHIATKNSSNLTAAWGCGWSNENVVWVRLLFTDIDGTRRKVAWHIMHSGATFMMHIQGLVVFVPSIFWKLCFFLTCEEMKGFSAPIHYYSSGSIHYSFLCDKDTIWHQKMWLCVFIKG